MQSKQATNAPSIEIYNQTTHIRTEAAQQRKGNMDNSMGFWTSLNEAFTV